MWTLRHRTTFLVDVRKRTVYVLLVNSPEHVRIACLCGACDLTRMLTVADSVAPDTCFTGIFLTIDQHDRQGSGPAADKRRGGCTRDRRHVDSSVVSPIVTQCVFFVKSRSSSRPLLTGYR